VQGKRLGTKMARTSLHGARVGNGGTVGTGVVWSGDYGYGYGYGSGWLRVRPRRGLGVEVVGGDCGWWMGR
jgi:hypothetical protein